MFTLEFLGETTSFLEKLLDSVHGEVAALSGIYKICYIHIINASSSNFDEFLFIYLGLSTIYRTRYFALLIELTLF